MFLHSEKKWFSGLTASSANGGCQVLNLKECLNVCHVEYCSTNYYFLNTAHIARILRSSFFSTVSGFESDSSSLYVLAMVIGMSFIC